MNDIRARELCKFNEERLEALLVRLIGGPGQFRDDGVSKRAARDWVRRDRQSEAQQVAHGEPGHVIVVGLVWVHVRKRVQRLSKLCAKDGDAGGIVGVRPKRFPLDCDW
jgi:hypothetical protein